MISFTNIKNSTGLPIISSEVISGLSSNTKYRITSTIINNITKQSHIPESSIVTTNSIITKYELDTMNVLSTSVDFSIVLFNSISSGSHTIIVEPVSVSLAPQ